MVTRQIRDFPMAGSDLQEFPWMARFDSLKSAYKREMYAITLDGELIGAMFLDFETHPELVFFEICPRWRGRGMGQAALEILFDMLRKQNSDRLVVQTGRPEIYRGMGFKFEEIDQGHIVIWLDSTRPEQSVNAQADACFIYSPRYLDHDDPLHPEHDGRVAYTMTRLRKERLLRGASLMPPRKATEEEILSVHTPELLERVKVCSQKSEKVANDTPTGPESFPDACLSLGGALMAAELIEKHSQIFVLCRPPGHHAFSDHAGGFCFFNNMAALALSLWKSGYNPLIIDWDVHHGNGTQEILYELPIMYVSFHQKYLYPHSGREDETGSGRGAGYTRNFPLPIGMKDAEYLEIFQQIHSIAKEIKPDVVLVSAGQDGHYKDRHSGLRLSSEAYHEMGRTVGEAAAQHCNGRIILLLEGGYHLDANAESLALAIKGIREAAGNGKAEP
ncbi:GNAT family N-acetyltransferase [Thermodesulfobacteriota bacterium]